ncbi:MAG: DNA adenine methylase [Planctomycetota bacterium]|jgi:DNA adenine methylase
MTVLVEKSTLLKAKPFLKWAGGKGQLIRDIEARLPSGLKTGEIDAYVEPFVGGGAVFFYIAQKYTSIKHFYLFDINEDLVNCYNAVKNIVESIIEELKTLEDQFLTRDKPARKDFYYYLRNQFNSDKDPAKLIFLNKTCYNGLYRVNKKGGFNVPFGDYKKPTICNESNLRAVSHILQKTEIICSSFENGDPYITETTFVYFDPPYRPLSPTASFTSYSKDSFLEQDQIKLAEFCRHIDAKSAKFLLSNSDPKNKNSDDHFFEDHYKGFNIEIIQANRAINCKPTGRGQINELLITNY